MSWWDYGYQITAMANRTVIVDNNTWNNTHISRVGQAMASTEDKAYEIMRELDVDYVLVIFGGVVGYSSDGELAIFRRVLLAKKKGIFMRALCGAQISINSCGWFVSADLRSVENTSRNGTTIRRLENFVSTVAARLPC